MDLQKIKRTLNNPSLLDPGVVMRISLLISILFHIILLLAFPEAFHLQWVSEELRTYSVELFRPPVEDINSDEIPEPDIARIQQEKLPAAEDDQATISLDTKDKRYVSYAKIIKEKIGLRWRYPPEALESLLEGKLLVIFSLTRGGNLIQSKIIDKSGYKILDEEALKAIRAAAPFPSFPEHIKASRLNIKATFDYRFGKRK
jgi:TonB family protein